MSHRYRWPHRTWNGDPSGPHVTRAIVDHATVSATQILRGSVTVSGTAGQLFQFVATAFDASGNVVPGVVATWTVADRGVASVDSTGLVTMLQVGSTAVTATVDGRAYPTVASVTAASGVAQDGSLADFRNVATDAVLYGVYSGISGVVLDGSNNVSTWNDVRGATGYGSPLTQGAANARPSYSSVTGTLTFDGSNDVLASAPANALAMTTRPIALGYVGTISNGGYFAGLISADGSRLLALGTPAGVVRLHTPTADASTAYAAPDATTRAILGQYGFAPTVPGDATSNTAWLGVEVEPKLRALANPESSIEASGDAGISIGGLALFGQFGAIAVKELVIFASEVTAPVRAAFERYANARGAVPIAANKRAIAGIDSITAGFNVLGDGSTTDPTKSYFGQMITDGTLAGYDTANMGTPGRWITTVAQRPGYLAAEARSGDWSLPLGGTNDFQGGRTPAQIAADIKTACVAWKAGGGRVGLIGPTPRTGYDVTPINAILTTFDSSVRDFYVNPQLVTGITDPSDVTKYPDGLHMSTAAHTILKDAIKVACTAAGLTF